jgi:hypothetical protein
MKNDCFFIAANENQMEFLLKIKSELSGKKWAKKKFIFFRNDQSLLLRNEGLSLERVALHKYSLEKGTQLSSLLI